MVLPRAALRVTLSCIIVTMRGAGQPRASALAIASWKNTSSDPETKKRLSTPPSFIAATSASDHSSAPYSPHHDSTPRTFVSTAMLSLLTLGEARGQRLEVKGWLPSP